MRRGRILLAEDDPSDQLLTLKALRQVPYVDQVDVVSNGVEALDYLFSTDGVAAKEGAPLLVLLDVNLPKLSGIDVLIRIRSEPTGYTLPVVIMTSSREQLDIDKAYRAGANSYIRKPVDSREFNEAVRQLAQYWLGLNEVAYGRQGQNSL